MRRNLLFYLLITSILSFSLTSHAQKVFNLKDAVQYGVVHNKNVSNAELDLAIAKSRIGEITATAYPQVTGVVGLTHTIQPQPFFSPPGFSFGPPDPNAPVSDEELAFAFGGVRFSTNALVNVNWLLFSNTVIQAKQAAKVYTELSRKGITNTKINIAEAVTKAYYGVMVSEEQLQLLDINISRLDSLLRETRALQGQGFIEKLDVQRLEVQASNLKVQRQNVERLQELGVLLLKFQMGFPLKEPIKISEKLSDITFSEAQIVPVAQPFNYNERIEYAITQSQKRLQEIDVENQRKGYLPTVALSGNYGYFNGRQTITRFFTRKWLPAGSVGINASIPIFDGFSRKYKLDQSRKNLLKVENGIALLEQSIDLQLAQSQVQLRNLFVTLEEQKKTKALAEEVLRVSRIKYKEGVGTNLEVVTAELQVREAQTNYYTAVYNALIAKVDADKAAGRLFTE